MPALFLRTGEPRSFAEYTFRVRIPKIIQDVLETAFLPSEGALALGRLRDEIKQGSIRGLEEDADDRPFWDSVTNPILGRSWFDAPYFLAESFFYRRLLEATGYFRDRKGQGRDPFGHQKQTELLFARDKVQDFLRSLPRNPTEKLRALLLGSLFGNRADLSHDTSKAFAREKANASDLIVDQSDLVSAHICSSNVNKLAIILDNAATELVFDLALVDHLLAEGLVREVELHAKPHPIFVSDALATDVVAAIAMLAESDGPLGALGERLIIAISSGRVRMRTHWFYSSSLFYAEMPDDLAADLSRADLVLLKGDVNYRRLLCDLRWPMTTDFSAVTAHFPAPLAALRALKAEIVVGLSPGQAEALAKEDASWLVNGRRAVLQARIAGNGRTF